VRAVRLLAALIAALAVAWLGAVLYGYSVTQTARRHHVEAAWYVFAIATLGALAVQRRRDDPDPDPDPHPDPGTETETRTGTATGPPPTSPTPPPPRRFGWVVAAAVMASIALYWRTLWIGLLSDDFVLLQLPLLPGDRWEYLRPLPLLLWSVVHPLGGPPGLHALNIVLHGVNAALVCALACAIVPGARLGVGLLAAALFLTCPLAVEPVAWAAGVFDTALVTGALCHLLVLVHARTTAWATALAVVSVSAALATKEAAVALPLLGALLAIRRPVSWIAVSASGAVCIVYAMVRASGSALPLGQGSWRYLAKELVGRPFGALGEPWTAADISGMPVLLGVVVPLGFAMLIVGHAQGRHGSWRSLSTSAWVVAGAGPVLAYFFVAPDLSGSRYAYLPLVGWSILIAETAWRQGSHVAGRVAIAWGLGLAVLWTAGSHRRIDAYVDAARVRDDVVASATRILASNACETVVLSGPPAAHDGAHVLRNGLPEAMAASTGRRVTASADVGVPAGCAFVWQGSGFVPRVVAP
jgi:hypothetical protein